jgi:hypothetical protein
MGDKDPALTEDEIERCRDDAIRRVLDTSPKPNSAYVGKGERAKAKKLSRVAKSRRAK